MTSSDPAREHDALLTPILLFDGDCSFCTGVVEWLGRRLERRARILPWQRADLGALELGRDEAAATVWWIEPSGARCHSERAIAAVLAACAPPWRGLGRLLLVPGVRWLAAGVYRVVARLRGWLPGPVAACRRPGAWMGTSAPGPR